MSEYGEPYRDYRLILNPSGYSYSASSGPSLVCVKIDVHLPDDLGFLAWRPDRGSTRTPCPMCGRCVRSRVDQLVL